jgi:tRNA 2-thiouridine synthesizing protein E
MVAFAYKNRIYDIDEKDFLINFDQWDEKFAEGMAIKLGMEGGPVKEHWDVINAIRGTYIADGKCPLVYEICRLCGLRLQELKMLFPNGYLRGACKLAGITYEEGYLGQTSIPKTAEDLNVISVNKCYTVDVRGFLIDPSEWDEYYAIFRAFDMKISGGRLSERHWQIINYLRDYYEMNRVVPTVYRTCEENQIDLNELEQLFPDGYHRGAVKIAGLRVK